MDGFTDGYDAAWNMFIVMVTQVAPVDGCKHHEIMRHACTHMVVKPFEKQEQFASSKIRCIHA
jgi:hypothetical protein